MLKLSPEVAKILDLMFKHEARQLRITDYVKYPPSGLQCPYCKSYNTIGSLGFYECMDCDKDFNDGK